MKQKKTQSVCDLKNKFGLSVYVKYIYTIGNIIL